MPNRDNYRSAPQSAPGLPPGWIETIDPHSGRPYYANSSTGETSWDPPERPWPPSAPDYRSPQDRRPPPDRWNEEEEHDRRVHTTTSSASYSSNSRRDPNGRFRGEESSYMQAVRDLFDAERSSRQRDHGGGVDKDELEYSNVSPGMVADLIHIQKKISSARDGNPLDPMEMPPDAKPPRVEQARLEVRLATLKDQLKRLS